jgi:hypothetical protein
MAGDSSRRFRGGIRGRGHVRGIVHEDHVLGRRYCGWLSLAGRIQNNPWMAGPAMVIVAIALSIFCVTQWIKIARLSGKNARLRLMLKKSKQWGANWRDQYERLFSKFMGEPNG